MCKSNLFYFLLVLGIFSAAVALEPEAECTESENGPVCLDSARIGSPPTSINNDDCSLFLAPSSIPNAGWGVYTAKPLSQGDAIGEGDLYVPILDHFKTLPFRGQQRFLSWLGYIWPNEFEAFYWSTKASFPLVSKAMYQIDEGLNAVEDSLEFYDTEKKQVSAFAPGIASLLNSRLHGDNVVMKEKYVPENKDEPFAYQPLQASANLEAGSELFLDYGSKYHTRLSKMLEAPVEYDSVEDYNRMMDFSGIATEKDKRWLLNKKTRKRHKKKQKREVGVLQKKVTLTDKTLLKDLLPIDNATRNPIQTTEWLQTNGMCIDKLTSRKSTIAPGQEGAFTKTFIARGQVVAPAPLLVLKRDDLVIYESDPLSKTYRNTLDLSKPIGHELLLNYCFGHKHSDLLLIPYSPVVNNINHDASNPNTIIRWSSDANDKGWLKKHPIDVVDMSGKLRMDFVALRDIEPGEEITIDYGLEWSQAWDKYTAGSDDENFRHPIGVPDGFFPAHWMDVSLQYEVADIKQKLKPGELQQMRWKHNGKPVAKFAYRVGLPTGFSNHMKGYAENVGIVDEYKKVLYNPVLKSGDWYVFDGPDEGEWFTQRFQSKNWNFNMHYIAAWNEAARKSFIRETGKAGFDLALDSLGNHFGLDNITCFHLSFMGVTECDNSFTHTDVYATGENSFNIIWPIITVNGSKPELDVQSDNANVVISVNYEEDAAVVMGDWGYHKTSPIDYREEGQMRVVVGMYCSQMDDKNRQMLAHIYDGEEPAPFMGQFEDPMEYHWSNRIDESYSMTQ